jgi:hypothetical protein
MNEYSVNIGREIDSLGATHACESVELHVPISSDVAINI